MSSNKVNHNNYLGLDVGERRIGVAYANAIARLAEPIATIDQSSFETDLAAILKDMQIGTVVVGRPRGLDGQTTHQTEYTDAFITQLRKFQVRIETIDEAGSSIEAERILRTKHRPRWPHESVDSVAAMIILQDYLEENS